MHAWPVYKLYGNISGPFLPAHSQGALLLYLQGDAHGCSQLHQVRSDLCFSRTDILGEKPAFITFATEVFQEFLSAEIPEPESPRAFPSCPNGALPSTVPFQDNPLLLRLEIPERWRTRLIICRHTAILGTI